MKGYHVMIEVGINAENADKAISLAQEMVKFMFKDMPARVVVVKEGSFEDREDIDPYGIGSPQKG